MQERGRPQGGIVDCEWCKERKGRNKQIIHILSHKSVDALQLHLREVFASSPYCVEFFTNFYQFVHWKHGAYAHGRQIPVWMEYFDSHDVSVTNCGDAIMHFRKPVDYGEGKI